MQKGPFIYETFRSHLRGDALEAVYEYPLYTDSHITGEVTSNESPVQLVNARSFRDDFLLRAGVILRINEYFKAKSESVEWKTETNKYHAGNLADEVSALISLKLGIRLQATDPNRRFEPGGNPFGMPINFGDKEIPVLPVRFSRGRILPYSARSACLNDALIEQINQLRPEQAVAVVLSARTYQTALWNAESYPELAWLQFVSAVETAAVFWNANEHENPLDKLKISKPNLYSKLISQGETFAGDVASELVTLMGATNKFVKFLMKFRPVPQASELYPYASFDWSSQNLKRALSKIYEHRSAALHSGRPFPMPMCEPPHDTSKGFSEVPLGTATQARGATWLGEDTPLLLHAFENLVRHSLINWWGSMMPEVTSPAS